jgi:hypothetical protein
VDAPEVSAGPPALRLQAVRHPADRPTIAQVVAGAKVVDPVQSVWAHQPAQPAKDEAGLRAAGWEAPLAESLSVPAARALRVSQRARAPEQP